MSVNFFTMICSSSSLVTSQKRLAMSSRRYHCHGQAAQASIGEADLGGEDITAGLAEARQGFLQARGAMLRMTPARRTLMCA